MKKKMKNALTAIVMVTTLILSGVSAFGAGKTVVTTGSNVRFRAEASLTGNIITSLSKGAVLTEDSVTGEWAGVTYNGQKGFVNTQFLAEAPVVAEGKTDPNPVTPPVISGGGHVVCIDPGHQGKGDSTPEPIAPGASTTKARVAGGTSGTTSGLKEYQLTLAVGQLLKDELESRGYTVYMTRTSHDVNISNKERAQYATTVGAEISVRIHANGSNSAAVSGALCLAPSASNPYVGNLAKQSQNLSAKVLAGYCAATGFSNKGVQANDSMTGINWCTMPVTIIEMGFMTNPSDDLNMANADFQRKMAKGIADGIDAYFGS